jgi:hypothetical protein
MSLPAAFISGKQLRKIVFKRQGITRSKDVKRASSTKDIAKQLNDAISEFDVEFQFRVADGGKLGTIFIGGSDPVEIVRDQTTVRDEMGLVDDIVIDPTVPPIVLPEVPPPVPA